MRKDYRRGYKQGQKDMLKILFGMIVISGMFALMFAKAFMVF